MSDMSLGSKGKGVPQTFRTASGNNINFDWTDIAEGTGLVAYNLVQIETPEAEGKRILTTGNIYATPPPTAVEPVYQGETPRLSVEVGAYKTKNFDSGAFNFPRTIGGTAYVYFSWKATKAVSDNAHTGESYVKVHIQKWDGETETTIGTGNTPTMKVSAATASSSGSRTSCLEIPCTLINFAKGDKIRVSFNCYNISGGTGACRVYYFLACNPTNKDTANFAISTTDPNTWGGDTAIQTTMMVCAIPFRITT